MPEGAEWPRRLVAAGADETRRRLSSRALADQSRTWGETMFDHHFDRRARIRLRAVSALEKAGLTVKPDDQRSHVRTANWDSEPVWQKVRVEVLGEKLCAECDTLKGSGAESFYLEHLERLFFIGSSLGRETCRLLGGNQEQARQAGTACGLLNAFVSLFDKVYDDYSEMAPRLGEIVDSGVLEAALSIEAGPSGLERGRVRATAQDPIALRVLCRLMESYFHLCRSAAAQGSDSAGLAQLRTAILQLHRDEIRSVDMLLDSALDRDEVAAVLYGKSVEPGWAMLLTSRLFAHQSTDVELPKWRDVIISFGTAAWIMDDLADTVEDVVARRWNYVLLEYAGTPLPRLGLDGGRRRTAVEILELVLATNAVDKAAGEMCDHFTRGLELLGVIAPGSDALRRQLQISLNRWY